MAGLGFGESGLADRDIDDFEAAFREQGCPVQVELSTLAQATIAPRLTARGYRLVGHENVLGRSVAEDETYLPAPGVDISLADVGNFAHWLDAVVTGFSTPDTEGVPSHEEFSRDQLETSIADMASGTGFLHYLAHRDGVRSGAASLRMCNGVAQLCGSATLPEHRRHGVQTAFLSYRLAEASSQGCDVAVVTTQPGSKSQQNVQRRGFELLYARAILVLEGP